MSGFSLCVIGNSHVGAVWQAWKSGAIAARTGFSMTVFASPGTVMELDHRDGSFIPANRAVSRRFALTSGGKERIEIDKYDAFLLVGLGWSIDLGRLLSRCSVVEHLAHGSADTLVSHAFLVEMIKAVIAKSAALKFTRQIRADSSAPILIYPTPYPIEMSPSELSDPCLGDRTLLNTIVSRAIPPLSEIARQNDCEVFWQHPETIALPGQTKAKFAEGAVNLMGSAETHVRHVNPDFAVFSLRAILQRLGQASPASEPAHAHNHETKLDAGLFAQPAA